METEKEICEMDLYTENGFEPLTRARSNTWPLPRPEGYVDELGIDSATITGNSESIKTDLSRQQNSSCQDAESSDLSKKKLPRRNAWGTRSYAELITQAISSAKDKRLTLSQIYDWMVKNVPYFKNKGDSNSSAGWKNSIRHNLSLHSRFVRVHNEGTGKSSWWMLNPEASLKKSTRRRAASMEAGKFEKKRARAKKLGEILRNADTISCDAALSRQNSRMHRIAQKSTDFRPRASSSGANDMNSLHRYPHDRAEVAMTPLYLDKQSEHCPRTFPLTYQIEQQKVPSNNSQTLPNVPYNLEHQASQLCSVHKVEQCNCDLNLIQMEPRNTDSSYTYYTSDQYDQCFESEQTMPYSMTSQKTLLPIQEIVDFGSVELQVENQTMVRNNSMLDDIDEIIKREQYVTLDLVNNSLSTALYISNSNPANSWIHL